MIIKYVESLTQHRVFIHLQNGVFQGLYCKRDLDFWDMRYCNIFLCRNLEKYPCIIPAALLIWITAKYLHILRRMKICHDYHQNTLFLWYCTLDNDLLISTYIPQNCIPELQIIGGTEDNSKMIFFFSTKTYVVTPHQNCLGEMVLMRGHNVCFYGKIRKNYP